MGAFLLAAAEAATALGTGGGRHGRRLKGQRPRLGDAAAAAFTRRPPPRTEAAAIGGRQRRRPLEAGGRRLRPPPPVRAAAGGGACGRRTAAASEGRPPPAQLLCAAQLLYHRFLGFLRGARIEVVRFFGCGGLGTIMAPGRGTYGSVWSAAFQRCKKACKRILIWRQMRAFFNSVSEWCGRAAVLPGSCPAPARFLPDSCPVPAQRPVPARFLPGSCPVPAQRPVPARFLPGSCPVPARRPGRIRLGRAVPAMVPARRSRAATGRTSSRLGCCTTLVRMLA